MIHLNSIHLTLAASSFSSIVLFAAQENPVAHAQPVRIVRL
jgi:hypothetical protein